jgi:hypothetical protein
MPGVCDGKLRYRNSPEYSQGKNTGLPAGPNPRPPATAIHAMEHSTGQAASGVDLCRNLSTGCTENPYGSEGLIPHLRQNPTCPQRPRSPAKRRGCSAAKFLSHVINGSVYTQFEISPEPIGQFQMCMTGSERKPWHQRCTQNVVDGRPSNRALYRAAFTSTQSHHNCGQEGRRKP